MLSALAVVMCAVFGQVDDLEARLDGAVLKAGLGQFWGAGR